MSDNIEDITARAEAGDAASMAALGNAHWYGSHGLERNFDMAVLWYRRAAELQDPDGLYGLGWCYHYGQGVEVDMELAERYYAEAHHAGNTNAGDTLLSTFPNQTAIEKPEVVKFKKDLQRALLGDDAQVMMDVADAYWYGGPVLQDLREAVRWYHRAAKLSKKGFYGLGWCYEHGEGVCQDLEIALKCYSVSRLESHADSESRAYNMKLLLKTKNIPDLASAQFAKCSRLAHLGNVLQMSKLGDHYWSGQGVAQNSKIAVEWYRRAAEHNCDEGMFNLAWCLRHGLGVDAVDIPEAFELYNKAAALGNVHAARTLYTFYAHGELPMDLSKFVPLLTLATEHNDVWAHKLLGYLYKTGKFGMTQDFSLAEAHSNKSKELNERPSNTITSLEENSDLFDLLCAHAST